MKKLIEKAISTLEVVTNRLRHAYIETYGDIYLAREFNSTIDVIKEKNKQEFVAEMAVRYAKNMKKDGLLVTPEFAFAKGNEIFLEAQRAGDIDELNNLKGQNNE